MPDETVKPSIPFWVWQGRPVILRVATGDSHTLLQCTVIGESNEAVRIRLDGLWDVDIFKEMVLAVEDMHGSPGQIPGAQEF